MAKHPMNIVSHDSARATFLFPLEETYPLDGIDTKYVFSLIAERYEFSASPDLSDLRSTRQRSGFSFELGHFVFNGHSIDITEFTIFTDGIVSTASTTMQAEAFLEDIMKWLQSELGFRRPISEIKKLFISNIVVDFDFSLSDLLGGRHIADASAKAIENQFGGGGMARISSVEFEFPDSSKTGGVQIPKVSIERRAGTDKETRYFSSAPLRTLEHIKLLTAMDGQNG